MFAEVSYLFRHAVLQDAAYHLQTPGDRGRLHLLALEIIEQLVPDAERGPIAAELADHLHACLDAAGAGTGTILRRELVVRELAYLVRAADHARREYDNFRALRLLGRILQHPAIDDATLVTTLHKTGDLFQLLGRMAEAERHLQAALAEANLMDGDSAALVAKSLMLLGGVYRMTGRVRAAQQQFEAALALHRAGGDRRSEATALGSLAALARNFGKLVESDALYREALAVHAEVGDTLPLGMTLGNHAIVLKELGRLAEAEATYQDALGWHRRNASQRYEAVTMGDLANLLKESGRLEEAKTLYLESLRIHRRVGARLFEGVTLANLANLLAVDALDLRAEPVYLEALAIHREVGNRRSQGFVYGNLASYYRVRGRLRASSDAAAMADSILTQIGEDIPAAAFGCNQGLALLLTGDTAGARELWRRGERVLDARRAAPLRLEYALPLGVRLALADDSGAAQAAALLGQMREISAGTGAQPGSDGGVMLLKCEALAAELEAAQRERREPLVFGGHLTSELNPVHRLAQIERMRALDPAAFAALARTRPRLLAAMLEGTQGMPVPDWRGGLD